MPPLDEFSLCFAPKRAELDLSDQTFGARQSFQTRQSSQTRMNFISAGKA